MPAFHFEKISSAKASAILAGTPVASTKRGVIVQLLDKLAETRLQREARQIKKAERDVGFTESDITPARTRSS